MKKLIETLRQKSEEIGYPLFWLLFYLPGFVLAIILIPKPLKAIGYLGLLFTELWEIGMLHTIGNRISLLFLPVIVMHPLIISTAHIFTQLTLKAGFSKDAGIPDESLLRLRIVYVIVAYVGITISVILREKRNRH